MLCDICGTNQATVHLTEIVDNQMTELHLCEDCAREKSMQMEQQFGLSDLLAGLTEIGKQIDPTEEITVECSNCKLTYKEFRKIGRLGCSECYTAFNKFLGPLLKRIHGSNQHLGKAPARAAKSVKKSTDLQELRNKLQKAIQDEAFEEAAGIRDKIRELEKKERNTDET
ncbi:MAG: UvrB/UvrC motif-containing protein [Candidatus Omnitrophota bacterium]